MGSEEADRGCRVPWLLLVLPLLALLAPWSPSLELRRALVPRTPVVLLRTKAKIPTPTPTTLSPTQKISATTQTTPIPTQNPNPTSSPTEPPPESSNPTPTPTTLSPTQKISAKTQTSPIPTQNPNPFTSPKSSNPTPTPATQAPTQKISAHNPSTPKPNRDSGQAAKLQPASWADLVDRWFDRELALWKSPDRSFCNATFLTSSLSDCSYRFGNLMHSGLNAAALAFSSNTDSRFYLSRPSYGCRFFDCKAPNEEFLSKTREKCSKKLDIYRLRDLEHFAWRQEELLCDTAPAMVSNILSRRDGWDIGQMWHQQVAALWDTKFSGRLVRPDLSRQLPKGAESEVAVLERYAIYGRLLARIYPIRPDVKDWYRRKFKPGDFDLIIGLHLRHLPMASYYEVSRRIYWGSNDELSKRAIKCISSLLAERNATRVGVFLATDAYAIFHDKWAKSDGRRFYALWEQAQRELGFEMLEFELTPGGKKLQDKPDPRTKKGPPREHSLRFVVELSELAELSDLLITTALSSSSQLIAERWVDRLGVEKATGRWKVLSRVSDCKKPHELGLERWEKEYKGPLPAKDNVDHPRDCTFVDGLWNQSVT